MKKVRINFNTKDKQNIHQTPPNTHTHWNNFTLLFDRGFILSFQFHPFFGQNELDIFYEISNRLFVDWFEDHIE